MLIWLFSHSLFLKCLIVPEVFDLDIVGEKQQYSQERADNENYKEVQYVTEQVSGNKVECQRKLSKLLKTLIR